MIIAVPSKRYIARPIRPSIFQKSNYTNSSVEVRPLAIYWKAYWNMHSIPVIAIKIEGMER
jgi:hypothetical protein